MKIRNNILVLDTETTGDFGCPIIHDIAWQIVDKAGKPLVTRNFLVKSVRLSSSVLLYSNFYRAKHKDYLQLIENGTEVKEWLGIEKQLIKDLYRYKVKTVSAYNLAFDFRALGFTSKFLNNGSTRLIEKIEKCKLLCLWSLACDTILKDNNFKEWSRLNEDILQDKTFISSSGNYITNAEIALRYIKNNIDFKADHTALSDVLIEVQLLNFIRFHKKGLASYGLKYNCWRAVQDKKPKAIVPKINQLELISVDSENAKGDTVYLFSVTDVELALDKIKKGDNPIDILQSLIMKKTLYNLK